MSVSRITSRVTRTVLTQCRSSKLLCARQDRSYFPIISNQFLSARSPHEKVSLLGHSAPSFSTFQWFGFSSSASPNPNDKENAESGEKGGNKVDNSANAATVDAADQSEAPVSDENGESGASVESQSDASGSVKRRETGTERVAFSDSDSDSDSESELSREDLLKLVTEKEELLKAKQMEHEQMKDKVLRTLAEMENVKDRTKREAENSKKFAIQNFAKSLLDVADNLGRASSAAKESFSKIETSDDGTGAIKQLKTLLEGVEMTEKQLIEVFRKFGVEKYDAMNEEFDPNRHNAVFQVPDASKPANHVAIVLKAGYILHDRVIRPAEVGVTVAADNVDGDEKSDG